MTMLTTSARSMPGSTGKSQSPQGANAADFDATRWMDSERLRLIYANLPVALSVSVGCACVLVILLRQVVSGIVLLAWLGAGLLITWLRYLDYRWFNQLPHEALDPGEWNWRVMLGASASGLWLGSAAAVVFPPGDLPHQIVINFLLAGISAGAMTSYTAIWRCYFLFVLPAILPMAFRMALQGTEIHDSLALLTVLYLGVVLRSAIQTDRMIGNVLKVRAENVELTKALHHQATHDELVNLPNYREFNARLAAEAESCAKLGQTYALLFIDLDRFKEINDTGGHAAGDAALRRIGHLLKRHLRVKDTAARMGGDEFAILLPGCPPHRAEVVAEKILADIEQFTLPWENGKCFQLGASIGLAYSEPGTQDTAAVLRAADAACYAAKTGGRGRIEVYRASTAYKSSGRFELSKFHQELPGC
jgi:diguanylate cyclase (GGDEF)-like protein